MVVYYHFHSTQGHISSDEHVIMWQQVAHCVYVYTTRCIECASVCVCAGFMYQLHCLLCSTPHVCRVQCQKLSVPAWKTSVRHVGATMTRACRKPVEAALPSHGSRARQTLGPGHSPMGKAPSVSARSGPRLVQTGLCLVHPAHPCSIAPYVRMSG